MFIICFGNGLGNQMFQYAFYLSMRKHYPDVDIKMDINYIQLDSHNGFELNRVFGIPLDNLATHIETLRLSNFYPGRGIFPAVIRRFYKVYNYIRPHNNHFHFEDGTQFHPEMFELDKSKDYLLDGTWTNEKYFEDIKEDIINVFQFRINLNERNRKYFKDIVNSNSVSIHIRRGDYLQSGFYMLTERYYKDALNIIKRYSDNIQLFIFTDDPEWVLDNMCFDEKMIIVEGNNTPNNYIDMYLMSRCKHNIIANSTFSFWGAYLNQNKGRIVVAPNAFGKNYENAIISEGWKIVNIREGN